MSYLNNYRKKKKILHLQPASESSISYTAYLCQIFYKLFVYIASGNSMNVNLVSSVGKS